MASAKERARTKTTQAIQEAYRNTDLFNKGLQDKAQAIHDKGVAAIELGVAAEASVVGAKAAFATARLARAKVGSYMAKAPPKYSDADVKAFNESEGNVDMPITPPAPDDPVTATEEAPVTATE